MSFETIICNWYKENRRDLPWRNTKNPYKIWLSEVILQQTRVEQGLPYYHAFVDNYPTVQLLADANEDDILKLWQGLGYYSRARNMHAAAKFIASDCGGKFPSTYDDIRALKGVGDYTAAAIASFAYKLCYPVIDGNVYRVLARYFGISSAIDSTTGKKEFKALAEQLIPKASPDIYNQAIMEFGAIQCTPKKPNCLFCPLQKSCYAYGKGTISQFPFKAKKVKQRNRFFNYLVLIDNQNTFLQKRTGKDVWQGLFQFPLIETPKVIEEKELKQSKEWNTLFAESPTILKCSKEYKHILSHQKIYAKFWVIDGQIDLKNTSFEKTIIEDLNKYAVPRLIENYLVDEKLVK